MKALRILLTLGVLATGPALADTTAVTTPGSGVDCYRSTTKIGHADTKAACVQLELADAERRKASANYFEQPVKDKTRITYTAPVVVPPDVVPPVVVPPVVVPPVGANCGLVLGGPVTFCDTFDAPKRTVSRAGDLDANVWGVSRLNQMTNPSQGMLNRWNKTTIIGCDGSRVVTPPNDVIICNGQLREAVNDNNSGGFEEGVVTVLQMYPKQPMDFAGRTGTFSFDVSNNSFGTHAAWPEAWVTDLPIPAPFSHYAGIGRSMPKDGFGLRLDAFYPAGQGCNSNQNLNKARWSVDSVVVSRNYVVEDTDAGTLPTIRTAMKLTQVGCVTSPTQGQMNHVELRINQQTIEVWATDAGVIPSVATLRKIAVVTDADLKFTRGLVWIGDAHYNADKGPHDLPSQREHTFAWDRVAFDGPFVFRDFSYDALDNTVPGDNGSVNLGRHSDAGKFTSWDVLGLPANRQAAAVRVLFNFINVYEGAQTKLSVKVNGNLHTVPWPFPDEVQNQWRTFAVTVPITDLVTGTNKVEIGADSGLTVSNVNVVLVNVPGGVPVLPGADNSYPLK